MTSPEHLLANNRRWAERTVADDPEFFSRLAKQQQPEFLWIGCSDSRVPANQITGLLPGEIFVHRNVANVISPDDPNCMSVVEYAVNELGVTHIIVCGHYGCGGVRAAQAGLSEGTIGGWLASVREVHENAGRELAALDAHTATDRLCELNVLHQLKRLCSTDIVRNAWAAGRRLSVHGWIYSISDGLLIDLGLTATSQGDLARLD